FLVTRHSITYTLSLHDALPICASSTRTRSSRPRPALVARDRCSTAGARRWCARAPHGDEHGRPARLELPLRARSRGVLWVQDRRSEEHTSELQSRENLVCRLLL